MIPLPPDELFKQLINQIEQPTQSPMEPQLEETGNEIIWQGNLDGTNYYIVRSRQKSPPRITLSSREKAIARLVAQGLPNKCIGHQLDISPWTVASYLRRIFAKLGVTSRTAMINQLMQEKILQD